MWVYPLDVDFPEARPAEVGGKAAGLYRLKHAGFRVPAGYVVTTHTFRRVLRDLLRGLTRPEEMYQAVLDCEIPVEVERAVADAHAGLFRDQPVAVRSSSTSEDAREHSFAGQLETVLGVRGVPAVLAAIRRVWASFFRPSNLLYRGRVMLDAAPSDIAVVVQGQLEPRVAGVMFTVDPVAAGDEHLVISATSGLGEAVVGGRAAETAYVDRVTGQVVEHTAAPGASPVLTGDDIGELLVAGRRIGQIFQRPQDVEWAIDDDGLALLQSRPVTTGSAGGARATVWSNVNVGEALPGVGTPMTWSIIRDFSRYGFEKAFGALGLKVPDDYELFGSFRGRIYLNLTQFASVFSQIPFMRIDDVLAAGGGSEADVVERVGYERRSKASFLARLPLTLSRLALSQVSMPSRGRRWARRFRRRRDRFFGRELSLSTRGELLRLLAELDRDFFRTGAVMLACGSNFLSSYIVTQKLLRRWGGPEAAEKEPHLFSGLRGLVSAAPGLELLDMARYVRDHPPLESVFASRSSDQVMDALDASPEGRALSRRLSAFLKEYGHRGAGEAELATPRWNERPEFLLEVIRSHLESPYLPSAEALASERERSRRETTEMIRQYFWPGLGLIFRGVLGWTQMEARLREELRACVTDSLAMYRRFFLEAGKRLLAERALSTAEDVFFLTRAEVVDYLERGKPSPDLALRAAMRRAEYVVFSESADPPDTFALHAAEAIPDQTVDLPPDARLLTGLPASPGRITGRARVIRDLSGDARVHPGEILVAPFTDVGWTPLFLVAAGLVTELGGPLSHSAVVAREYGIPAVVSVKQATTIIRTGDLITVDGQAGKVFFKRGRDPAADASG
jgi:pyruvate,water dikinase